jgi:hypothetical protein
MGTKIAYRELTGGQIAENITSAGLFVLDYQDLRLHMGEGIILRNSHA